MKNKTRKIQKDRRSAFVETALLSILLTSLYYANSGRQKAILHQSSDLMQVSPSSPNQAASQQL